MKKRVRIDFKHRKITESKWAEDKPPLSPAAGSALSKQRESAHRLAAISHEAAGRFDVLMARHKNQPD